MSHADAVKRHKKAVAVHRLKPNATHKMARGKRVRNVPLSNRMRRKSTVKSVRVIR